MQEVINDKPNATLNSVISVVLTQVHFDITEILKLATVSRDFNKAANQPLVWRLLARENGFKLSSIEDSVEKPIKDEDIKYRLLNTLLLNQRLVQLRNNRPDLPPTCLEANANNLMTAGGCVVSCGFSDATGLWIASCVAKSKCSCCLTSFFELCYPACFVTSVAGCAESTLCIIFHATPIVAYTLTAVTCLVIGRKQSQENKETLAIYNGKIQHIENLQKHGIFQQQPQNVAMQDDGIFEKSPTRLSMSDEDLIPLLEKRSYDNY